MNALFAAAAEMQHFLQRAGERYCFIEERCVTRATEFDFGEARLLTCSAEDLVVLKAFAGRPQDWVDIESVAVRQQQRLDWKLVFEELEPLAAVRNVPGLLDRLRQLRSSASQQD